MLIALALLTIADPVNVMYHGPEKPGAADVKEYQAPQWEAGNTVFIAVHETNLRKSAAADSETIALLPLAAKVKVTRKASEMVKVGYRADYWYEVDVDGGAHGFVFGGALTPVAFTTDLDDDGKPESATVAWSPDYKVRVRFLKDGVAKQLDLRAGGQAYVCCGGLIQVVLVDKAKAGVTLLQVGSSAEACGDTSVALVAFFGGEPHIALETGGLVDPPNYSEVKFIYAPKKRQVTLQRKNWSDEDGGEKAAETRNEVFKLKDGVFKSVKTAKSTDS